MDRGSLEDGEGLPCFCGFSLWPVPRVRRSVSPERRKLLLRCSLTLPPLGWCLPVATLSPLDRRLKRFAQTSAQREFCLSVPQRPRTARNKWASGRQLSLLFRAPGSFFVSIHGLRAPPTRLTVTWLSLWERDPGLVLPEAPRGIEIVKRARPRGAGISPHLLVRLKQKDSKFQVCWGYRVNSRSAWRIY